MTLVAEAHTPNSTVRTGAPGGLRRLAFHAMGTPCEIQYACAQPGRGEQFERAALQWVTAFEAKYSRYRPDSLVSRINDAAGRAWVPIDEQTGMLFDLCESLHRLTHGVLDPTLLPLLRVWDYKTRLTLPSSAEVDAARQLVGWSKVRREPGRVFLPETGMALDFGGFGKEYAVDVVAQLAIDHGLTAVLVDFGHDIRIIGAPPGRPAWHIGLEEPRQPGSMSGSVGLRGSRGIASSGDYVRRFLCGGRRYGHIVDPRTGWPVANGCLQATVIADNCLLAGVLSTTAFVLGARNGIEFIQGFLGAEGLIVTENARAQTRGFFNYVVTS